MSALWGSIAAGTIVLISIFLISSLVRHAAIRMSATMFGIKISAKLLGWLPYIKDNTWSGNWDVIWNVDSELFNPTNTHTAKLYRFLGKVAVEGVGVTTEGARIPYGFVGSFSRADSVISGEWFDKENKAAGYHGTFQIKVPAGERDRPEGLWIGFSDTHSTIKSGHLAWRKKRLSPNAK